LARPADLRRDHCAGVQHHAPARTVLPHANGSDGGTHRTGSAVAGCPGAYRPYVPARHAAALRHPRVARDAAPARSRAEEFGLPALLGVSPLELEVVR